MAGAEHDHRLPVRRRDDVARVRRDARAIRERAEVQRLEMRERGVLALDVHHRSALLGGLAVEQRTHREVAPPGLPQRRELVRQLEHLASQRRIRVPTARRRQRGPVRVGPALGLEVAREQRVAPFPVLVAAGAGAEDGERVVRADDDRVWVLLEDLHRHAIAAAVLLEDQLRPREVDVALVARADLFDREPKGLRSQALSDDHHMLVSMPPSTWRLTPVMYDARGEARNTAAAANSSGRP